MKKKIVTFIFLFSGLISLSVVSSNHYRVASISLPKKMNFAGEEIPIHDPEVLERIDRELLVNKYWQSNTILSIKRASKYFPIIEPILKNNDIPDDFKYLALIESNFIPTATSPSGAKGIWQIMKATGKELGLEINDNIDQRMDLEKATQAACIYIKEMKQKLGTWTLSAIAYNAGLRGIKNHLYEQNSLTYYGLVLREEASRYVFRIIAMKEILSNPKKYGFDIRDNHLYEDIEKKVVNIDYDIPNLPEWANNMGYSYKAVKTLNPWILGKSLENKKGNKYSIYLPRKKDIFVK